MNNLKIEILKPHIIYTIIKSISAKKLLELFKIWPFFFRFFYLAAFDLKIQLKSSIKDKVSFSQSIVLG